MFMNAPLLFSFCSAIPLSSYKSGDHDLTTLNELSNLPLFVNTPPDN